MMGYWAAEVGSSIAGTTPLIGDFLQHYYTVAKAWDSWHFALFAFHVAILPAAAIWFLLIHLIAFRQFGSVGPSREEKRNVIGEFWPDQAFKDLLVVLGILVLLIGLRYLPAPISGPADPLTPRTRPSPSGRSSFSTRRSRRFTVVGSRWAPSAFRCCWCWCWCCCRLSIEARSAGPPADRRS